MPIMTKFRSLLNWNHDIVQITEKVEQKRKALRRNQVEYLCLTCTMLEVRGEVTFTSRGVSGNEEPHRLSLLCTVRVRSWPRATPSSHSSPPTHPSTLLRTQHKHVGKNSNKEDLTNSAKLYDAVCSPTIISWPLLYSPSCIRLLQWICPWPLPYYLITAAFRGLSLYFVYYPYAPSLTIKINNL